MRALPRVAGTAVLATLLVVLSGVVDAQAATPTARHHHRHRPPVTTSAPTTTTTTTTTTAPTRTPSSTPTASPTSTAASTPTTPSGSASSAADQVLTLVNDERSKAGCGPVRLDARLTAAATKHSRAMADNDFFSHVSLDGATFVDRIRAEGYPTPRSENIAAGNSTAAATMQQWMNSAGHRANILDCTAKDMGVGVATNPSSTYRSYWTQDFGRG